MHRGLCRIRAYTQFDWHFTCRSANNIDSRPESRADHRGNRCCKDRGPGCRFPNQAYNSRCYRLLGCSTWNSTQWAACRLLQLLAKWFFSRFLLPVLKTKDVCYVTNIDLGCQEKSRGRRRRSRFRFSRGWVVCSREMMW